jgi:hypothetical protein
MASSIDRKVRENRLRRMADRQGLRLAKSRRRDPMAIDYRTYRLMLKDSRLSLRKPPNGLLTIDQVEAWLTGEGVE